MEFYDVIGKRRSIRSYKPDAVSDEALRRIGEAVRSAPTACNRQPYKMWIVRNPEKRAALAKIYAQKWFAEAPAIAVIAGCESEAWHRLEGDTIVNVDVAIAMEHFSIRGPPPGRQA